MSSRSFVLIFLVLAGCSQVAFDSPNTWIDVLLEVASEVPYVGYEPTVDVSGSGTVYVSVHRPDVTDPHERTSPVFYSVDGRDWEQAERPDVHAGAYTFEGDLATRGSTVYFVEVAGLSGPLVVWEEVDGRPVLRSATVARTMAESEDRPWLEVAADGTLFYLTSNAAGLAAPDASLGVLGSEATARARMYAWAGSEWEEIGRFPGTQWCDFDVDEDDSAHLFVGCMLVRPPPGLVPAPPGVGVFESFDAGETWAFEALVPYDAGPAPRFPSVAMFRGEGLLAWIDDEPSDDTPATARIGAGSRSERRVVDVPFPSGSAERISVSASSELVAVSAYVSEDLRPTSASEWAPYLAVARDWDGPWMVRAVGDRTSSGMSAPGDFHEIFVRGDEIHIAYGMFHEGDSRERTNYENHIHYARYRVSGFGP